MAAASPSTSGVRPNMSKMYDGRNVATRPIPIIHDTEDDRAIASAAIQMRPKTFAVNMPSGPRPSGANTIFGTPVSSPGNVIDARSGIFNPLTGTQNFH